MCGIVGYIGKKEAYPVILKGLKRLEYRGYDSAGIAFHEGDKDNPIAHCTASFMRLSPEAIEKSEAKQ